jgi:hypothetical protein
MSSSSKTIAIVASLSAVVLFGSAFSFYRLIKPLVEVEQKPEPIECQLAYAKAKACIEMESRYPDKFKYNP